MEVLPYLILSDSLFEQTSKQLSVFGLQGLMGQLVWGLTQGVGGDAECEFLQVNEEVGPAAVEKLKAGRLTDEERDGLMETVTQEPWAHGVRLPSALRSCPPKIFPSVAEHVPFVSVNFD